MTIFLAVVVLGLGTAILLRARRASRALHERDGLTHFRETYAGRGYSDSLLLQAYRYLAERHGSTGPHYEVSPADNLARVYGLADLDLEDAVLVIADRASVRLPKSKELDALKEKVSTVDNLLRFLDPYFRGEPVQG